MYELGKISERQKPLMGEYHGIVVIKDLGTFNDGDRYAVFKCPLCEEHFKRRVANVKNGRCSSCGCLQKSIVSKLTLSHGDARKDSKHHSLYRAWWSIKSRCYNPNTPSYHRYGGRGITMCEEWLNSYISFREWSLKNGWKKGLTIDKDISGLDEYSPKGCVWVSHSQNMHFTKIINKEKKYD